jgi:hypothetical protein
MSGLSRALLSNAAPVPGLAPLRAGRRASKSVVKGFAAALRISRSSRAGRKNARKNSSGVITLATSSTASFSDALRFWTRSR